MHPFLHSDGAKLRQGFRSCKRFPTWRRLVSDLACIRAVSLVCARSQAYRSGRGTPALQGPLKEENGVSFFPNWRNFVTQLGSKFFPVRQQCGPARCPERPQCPASTGTEQGCKIHILSTNQLFIYTNYKSTSRARNILVFINSKNNLFSLFFPLQASKQGSSVWGVQVQIGSSGRGTLWTLWPVSAYAPSHEGAE